MGIVFEEALTPSVYYKVKFDGIKYSGERTKMNRLVIKGILLFTRS